jgi:hypothetical protein
MADIRMLLDAHADELFSCRVGTAVLPVLKLGRLRLVC